MTIHFTHHPVLLEKTLALLELRPGSIVLDATVGGGGHAAAILERTAPDGKLIGFDADAQAIEASRVQLRAFGDRVELIQTSFRQLPAQLARLGISRLDAALFDLGVSSPQLDDPTRGFRFAADSAQETPLDMRMNRSSGPSAAELLASASTPELTRWFRDYGELPGAARLARVIAENRRQAPLHTVRDLLQAISEARVGGGRRHNPATLVFQALRIAVNDELQALEDGLTAAIEALAPGGRIAVLAYHSLEDRIVKHRFREEARSCICPPRMPVCCCDHVARLRVITRRVVRPEEAEIRTNPRARSARLRAAERLVEAA